MRKAYLKDNFNAQRSLMLTTNTPWRHLLKIDRQASYYS